MVELADLLQASGGRVHGPVHATRFDDFCFDSRDVGPGQLFVAVRTAWGDGHDFIADACRGGACGILCECPPRPEPHAVTCIVVADTQAALTEWARFVLRKQQTEVVGVTGSAGKTTTKEAIALVLGAVQPVFKNPASYGGRFGLPIGLGRLQPEHHLAVLELACDSPGEMAELIHLAGPRHGVVLNISPAHFEAFGSLESIALEKGRLVQSLPPGGWAILNADDPRVAAMAERTAARVLTFGLGPAAAVRATEVHTGKDGLRFTLSGGGQNVAVSSSLLGQHNVYALLAAAAVGLAYGLDLSQIAAALHSLEPQPGCLRPLDGRNGSIILDDSHSATPAAVTAALDTLATFPGRPRIAVLGDMAQLGSYAQQAHRSAGRQAAGMVDLLVTIGEGMRLAGLEAVQAGLPPDGVRVTYTPEDALRAVDAALRPGAAVLVKGSAEARLERVVRGLLRDPARAGEWLVRQGPGWQGVDVRQLPRPTWVEVDLEAIAHNVRRLRHLLPAGVRLMAVVKADGYGHGAIKTARTALNNGASWLGVACLSEALTLREEGIDAPILVLGYTPPWQARELIGNQVRATVFSLEVARALSRASADMGRPAMVHVKVDTGMGRLGLLPGEALPFLSALHDLPGLVVEGVFTHLATADVVGDSHCRRQLQQFGELLARLAATGLRPPLAHAANSAAALTMLEAHFDMVRIGIALYGLNPSAQVTCPPDLRPALAFKTQVAQVKTLPRGSCVSYGCAYRTPYDARIAVIPVGYADGFRRAPQHWGEVLIRGQRAPIVGRVCMDQTMIDVTHVPGVRAGDQVVLIGAQGEERITADQVAERLGTINYEVVSEILARVPRVQ